MSLSKVTVESVQSYKRTHQSDLKWGILGAGRIAGKLAEALAGTEGSMLYAVASRSLERAVKFSEDFKVPNAYGSYEALVEDPEIDIVYVANLHHQHVEAAKLALNAGKAVLCEKPITINAKEAEELISLARMKNVFLMEALWMRYNPNIAKMKEWLNEGRIGKIVKIEADFSIEGKLGTRLLEPELSGGALLDLGIYPISFANYIMGRFPDQIKSQCKLAQTLVDGTDKLNFKWSTGEVAELTFGVEENGSVTAKVMGTDGYIEITKPFFATQMIRLVNAEGTQEYSEPFRINGYEYEVEEVMRCIDGGQKESPIMPLDETLRTMKLMDSLRAEWGVAYPFEKE